MAYYLIAAGGTGAKCVQAFIHMCAAGLMEKPDQPVQIVMVDADTTNGNRNTAADSINLYQQAQKNLTGTARLGTSCPIFRTPIIYDKSERYNLNFLEHYNHNLETILKIKALPKPHQALFRALYTQEKREEARFQNGFLGWPSVGSAIISSAYEQIEHLAEQIAGDATAKVLLMGSIFGGTGAASIPTLAKLLYRSFENKDQELKGQRSLGLVLMLPYFTFDNSKGEKNDTHHDNPNIDPQNFALKTRIALRYYYNHEMHAICNRIYLLGDSQVNKVAVEKQIGGVNQNNKPNYMELYAALAATDFFKYTPEPGRSDAVYHETCRRSADIVYWTDLPSKEGQQGVNNIYEKLYKATSTAYIYNASFMPLFRNLHALNHGTITKFPWYGHLIAQPNVDLKSQQPILHQIHTYYHHYLQWLYDLHRRIDNDPVTVDVHLFEQKSLENYLKEEKANPNTQQSMEQLSKDYIHLVKHLNPERVPPKGGLFKATGFDLVRKKMDGFKLTDQASDIGIFFNALYHCSL
jgi:hypothetical protein